MQHSSKLISPQPQTTDVVGAAKSRTVRSRNKVLPNQGCLQELDFNTRIIAANVGDHSFIQQLLAQSQQRSLAEDFQSCLDAPAYKPSDRLLLQRDGIIIGHVQISRQIGWFQEQRYPHAKLRDFFVLPEYRAMQYDKALLDAAEKAAADEGSALAIVHTDQPEWFEQHGWSTCHGQGYTRANTRAILSHLSTTTSRHRSTLEVRSWRHFELDSLEQIYSQLSTNTWGMLHRSAETWQWLVGRKAHDQILMVVERTSKKSTDSNTNPRVVGYAVVRDSCIVEMLTLPGYSSTRTLLVARACRDAIDRDHHFVSLHTPAADPMHELLITAGGNWVNHCAAGGGKLLLKLLSPSRWVERLYPILHERAREAGISLPLQIDFEINGTYQRLTLTRRSARLDQPAEPMVQARCNWHTFQDMLASNLSIRGASGSAPLETQHDDITHTLATLFPAKLFWQSPFPLLRL